MESKLTDIYIEFERSLVEIITKRLAKEFKLIKDNGQANYHIAMLELANTHTGKLVKLIDNALIEVAENASSR